MEILVYLAGVTARSLSLAAVALLGMRLFRVKTAAARHAVLTVVTGCMLLLAVLAPVLPPVPLRVLRAKPGTPLAAAVPGIAHVVETGPRGPGLPPRRSAEKPPFPWDIAGATVYCLGAYCLGALILLARLAYGHWFTQRLAGASRRDGDIYESEWITAPMTVGCMRPKILLPAGWRKWEPAKLQAVLVHERIHIRRADWLIALMAAFNRCIFWFNPLAWWLARRLAVLAEQACDDAALLATGSREPYAQALLDIAAAVRTAGGRLNWEAMAMTKPSEVQQRIERILDESRHLSPGLGRRPWIALATSGFAAACLITALHLAPIRAAQTAAGLMAQLTDWRTARLTPEEVARMERAVAQNPEDIDARSRLILEYLVTGRNEQRARHTLWMIEHHPEAEVHEIITLFGDPGPLQDVPAYTRAAALWQQQAELHASDPRVVLNAARFFDLYFALFAHDPWQGEQWIKRARGLDPGDRTWPQRLAGYYSRALWEVARGDATRASPTFAEHARAELETSRDGFLLWQAGITLANSEAGRNPKLRELNEFGRRLQTRALELGFRPPNLPVRDLAAAAAAKRQADFGPQPITREDPAYPPLAYQARIQGTVRLSVLVSKAGTVLQTEVMSGHPLLVKAAQEAVMHWMYAPQPMETLIEVEVPFRLVPQSPAAKN